jgi:hypothetical protein
MSRGQTEITTSFATPSQDVHDYAEAGTAHEIHLTQVEHKLALSTSNLFSQVAEELVSRMRVNAAHHRYDQRFIYCLLIDFHWSLTLTSLGYRPAVSETANGCHPPLFGS